MIYSAPDINIIEIGNEDIITTSNAYANGLEDGGNDDKGGFGPLF